MVIARILSCRTGLLCVTNHHNWIINRFIFKWYVQTSVSEDSNDNDADDNSTRDVTFSVDGTPKRGWTALSDQQSSDVDYVFRGLDIVTGTGDAETNGGTAWDKATDGGVNGGTAPAGECYCVDTS